MDDYMQLLSRLLSNAIRNKEISIDEYTISNWKNVYEESKNHQVNSLLYPLFKNKVETQEFDYSLISYRNEVLTESMLQIQNMDRICEVLNNLNREGIPVIILKGLALRELYPYPELRIMTDADILVHKEDIECAKHLLKQMEYHISNSDSKHIHFPHNAYMPIELHRSLTNKEFFKNAEDFENEVWSRALPAKFQNAPVFILSPEDQLMHLLLHMAMHLISSGFGLRQLCDLTLLVESKRELIDWDSICKKVNQYGIYRFTIMIFLVCKKLLQLDIPEALYCYEFENDPNVDLLIGYIYSCGVFGMRTDDMKTSGLRSRFIENTDPRKPMSKLSNIITLLFPPANKLGTKYAFIHKHPLLIPVAWFHRIIRGIFRRDLSLSEKAAFLFPSKESQSLLDERFKLLHWLELR